MSPDIKNWSWSKINTVTPSEVTGAVVQTIVDMNLLHVINNALKSGNPHPAELDVDWATICLLLLAGF